MHIGVDFDNTIVCYDALFHRVAVSAASSARSAARKSAVREHLRQAGREETWTELQGLVYGRAWPKPSPIRRSAILEECRRRSIRLSIISHKTRQPVVGPPCDLHQAALSWLEQHQFFHPEGIGLSAPTFSLKSPDPPNLNASPTGLHHVR